jgi:hypothetical protein
MAWIIPLDGSPNQTMDIQLNVNGGNISLRLFIRYNETAKYWTMRVTDAATGKTLIDALPLITGDYPAGDLLKQYQHLRIGSAYVINNGYALDYPDDTSLGTGFSLLWGDNAA